ncbi:MAG: glycogen synthase [Elusimicrobiota bacterium]|jgi:starch synthase
MRIVFAASEAVPFCKTGGLADVAGALPRVLARKGHRVALFLPYYRAVAKAGFRPEPAAELRFLFDGAAARARLLRLVQGELEVFFVQQPALYDREGLYGADGRDYLDNGTRFAFFSRAVLEGAKAVGLEPDVFHCHDWQTGLVPPCLRLLHGGDPALARAASVFTIHNAAYQGVFPKELLASAGLPQAEFTPEGLEYYGQANYLKSGAVYSELLSTVSPTYAGEIRSSAEFGRGLEGVYLGRGADLRGILNGLDLELWNPLSDGALPRRFGPGGWREGKREAKALLRRKCGFVPAEGPLIGAVTRLDRQKGLDLVLEAVPGAVAKGAQFAMVALGDPELDKGFRALAAAHPRRVHFHPAFDDPFARLLYAASDLFLMPSRFEPCGLGQMIAMRYGSVPVAVRTGGLADTVRERAEGGRPANGFLAARPDADELSAALDRALAAFRVPEWAARVDACLAEDFSWERSAERYAALYEEARARRA